MPSPNVNSKFLSSPWIWVALGVAMLVLAATKFYEGRTVWGLINVGIALGAAVRGWLTWRGIRQVSGG